MSLNKDGLEPGKPVEFADFKRIQRQHREKRDAKPEPKAEREEVRGAEQRGDEDSPKPARKKAPKKSG